MWNCVMAPTRRATIAKTLAAHPPTTITPARSPVRPAPFAKGLAFLGEFIRSPFQTGALHESPPQVARALSGDLGLDAASNVVEFGPGTGPVTREIVGLIPDSCRFFAIEKNPRLARLFRERLPKVDLVDGSVEHVGAYMAERGMGPLDAVVSSIPWILLPPAMQDRFIAETVAVMRPGGRFSMITYRHERSGLVKRFVDLMRSQFSAIDPPYTVRSRFSFAHVYRATK
jgi:phospholipid N-methyltransferase